MKARISPSPLRPQPCAGRRSTLRSTEMARGLPEPSYEWRRDYALVLGLERVLSDPQPRLASGTTLRRHQVDALAGQLAALISDLERSAAARRGRRRRRARERR